MKQTIINLAFAIFTLTSCINKKNQPPNMDSATTDNLAFKNGYSDVNGIKMYYEIYGQGKPLVLVHGGGSTIQDFQRIIPLLAKSYSVVAVELQNHGRSGFRNVPQTFEQDADDVAVLLNNLGITNANFFGFSNGGTTTLQIGIRHPKIVNKLVLGAAAYKKTGLIPGLLDGLKDATLDVLPQELKTAFLKVNPDSAKLQIMFEKDRDRMIAFKDLSNEQIKSITAPTLIINGDADVVLTEHAVEMYRLIPNSQLAIIPGGHGKYLEEIMPSNNGNRDAEFVVYLIKEFLEKSGNPE